ncbi:MAG TPA: TonB family protein [Saprospiraceae bacterium]|nr:TonB family protein [Saprospiraceae bacterium]
MDNTNWLKRSIDDIVFEGRNKAYGAFLLRRIYDKHMSRAMISGILFFLLVISSPQIIRLIKGFLPEKKEKLEMREVTLAEPPPIDPKKPPPPPPPKVEPPPIKDQIKFVPPKVKKDEEVKEEEPPPPTVEEIKDKEIATETKKGEEGGVDASLTQPEAPPAPPVLEEPKEEEPFTYVEQMPTFPDGQEAMYKYIYDRIKYPAIARENGISGQVIVQFVVSKDGDIKNAKVMRGIGGGCNEEALRVVNEMPKWKPGKHNGRAVPVTFTLPIKFVLQ